MTDLTYSRTTPTNKMKAMQTAYEQIYKTCCNTIELRSIIPNSRNSRDLSLRIGYFLGFE
jgi:hypothetical protein